MKPLLKGEDIKRYSQPVNQSYIFYPHIIDAKGKTNPIDEKTLIEKYPLAYQYISNFKNYLIDKKIKYKTNPTCWYSLHRAREKRIFESDKLITPQLQNHPSFAYDTMKCYPDAGGYSLIPIKEHNENLFYYYSILNSKLFYYFITSTSTAFNNNYYYFKTAYIEPFRFPYASDSVINEIKTIVRKILDSKQESVTISTKENEEHIDQLVYKLYNLTPEEIAIVEGKA
ncbi:MAG: hypothetical protein FWE03_03155 [Firmicutes bacterium]|nr:hypothetical protein [Bacillota bacterium]